MSKKHELTKLKNRIKYANSHLNTTLGIETMDVFIPSEPATVKNIGRISRELKKWQEEKKFKQKKENFSMRALKFNEIVPNNAFQFNAYPETPKQLEIFNKYLKKLKRNVIIKENEKVRFSKNFFKVKDQIISDMLKRHYIKKKDMYKKYDTLPTPVQKNLSDITISISKIKKIKSKKKFFKESDLKGFSLKYHKSFIDVAKLSGLPELENWIKKQGQYMSFYLYKKGYSITDFYHLFIIGEDKPSMLKSISQALSDIISTKYHDVFKINEYDNEISKFVKTLKEKISKKSSIGENNWDN
ncbi:MULTISPECIES: hypothetical protein [unclassified Bartonella]|uniref:hypothetical protein n=1 Tax=unclassified Bartonella TaxID=2645622 RepID=UPI0023611EE7|nr:MULTISPECIES: hypothetical protein [unclassified Bartonella]